MDEVSTAKGYDLGWFEDVFSRYLASTLDPTVTPSQLNENGDLQADPTATSARDVTVKEGEKPNENGQRYGVAVDEEGAGDLWEADHSQGGDEPLVDHEVGEL